MNTIFQTIGHCLGKNPVNPKELETMMDFFSNIKMHA